MDPIVTKARTLIKNLETNCPFKISKALGIQIVYEDLRNIFGYYSSHFRIKVIHINQNLSEGQKKFTCAHELGHALLHSDANTPFLKKHTLFSTDRIEMEANLFAVRLLFSDEHLVDQVSLEQAINQYGIPEKLILSYLDGKKFTL